MKKAAFLALAALSFIACNNLKENEYEINGEISDALNGKKAILQKPGGMMGMTALDTVVIENGKFTFRDTINSKVPELYSVLIDGVKGEVNFIMEPGSIDIVVDKDTVFKSTTKGTYNNDKLEEFKQISMSVSKKSQKFQKDNQAKMDEAIAKKDTATRNKLMKENMAISSEPFKSFIKDSPKALVSLFALQRAGDREEIIKLYQGLDASIKNTAMGKQYAMILGLAEAPKSQQPAAPEAEAPELKVKVGEMAPQFSGKTPEGKELSLKQAMGKVTIIDFWASWCGPCRHENPNVVAMYNEFHSKGLNIISVSLDIDAAKWKEAIAKDKLTWNHVSDLKQENAVAMQYGVEGIPSTVVLDASGKIVATNLRGESLKAKVAELLK